MRFTYYFLFLNFLFVGAYAQVTTPPASPRGKISQQLGLTQVEVDYSRPSARGRDIMGGLVRYGDIWRTGPTRIPPFLFRMLWTLRVNPWPREIRFVYPSLC